MKLHSFSYSNLDTPYTFIITRHILMDPVIGRVPTATSSDSSS